VGIKVIYFRYKVITLVITIARSFCDVLVYTVALKATYGGLFIEGRLEFDTRQGVETSFLIATLLKFIVF
jgi:hypothetical protein